MNTIMASFIAALLHLTAPYAATHSRTLVQSDTSCLAEAIYHEARGERDGGAAIAYVALNRAALENQTLCQVIHAKHQFSYYSPSHPKKIRELSAWKLSAYIAVYTQLGLIHNTIGNATSYNERPVRAWLRDMSYTKKIDHMYFYELKQNVGSRPLIETHSEPTPLLPRHITCDKEDDSHSLHLSVTQARFNSRQQNGLPLPTRAYDARESEVNRVSDVMTVSLPDTVPFPEKPSLSPGQVTTLVSAITSERPAVVYAAFDKPELRGSHDHSHHPRVQQLRGKHLRFAQKQTHHRA